MEISIFLSKPEAIALGCEQHGVLKVEVPLDQLTADERQLLASTQSSEKGLNMETGYCERGSWKSKLFPPTADGVRDLLRFKVAANAAERQYDEEKAAQRRSDEEQRKQKKKENVEAAITYLLSLDDDAFADAVSSRWIDVPVGVNVDRCDIKGDPRLAPQCERYWVRKKATEEQSAQEEEQKRLMALQQEERQEQQIAAWVTIKGTPSQQKRYAAKLLDRQEVLDAMEAEAFGPLSEWPVYEKLTRDDVEHNADYCDARINYKADDAESVDEKTFDLMEQLKGLLPAASVTPWKHVAECSACDGKTIRMSLRVEVTVGEFEFQREYGADR